MRTLRVAIAAGALALGICAFRFYDGVHPEPMASAILAWTFVAMGLAAWARRPGSRVGPLMIWVGFALFLRRFRYWNDDVLFTVGFLLGGLNYAAFAHTVLAYPAGRLQRAAERWLLRVGYPLVVAFPLAGLLVYDGSRRASATLARCGDHCPQSLFQVHASATAFHWLQHADRIALFGLLGLVFLALIARRYAAATPRARRLLAPLLLAALLAGLRGISEAVLAFYPHSEATRELMFWTQIAVYSAVPVALLAGVLRTRLARASVADLVVALERIPVGGVATALARALQDPSLEIVFWLPERRAYADGEGRIVPRPEATSKRAVTRLEHDGEPIAALVHDPALVDEPDLLDAVGAAARLALENARLHADLKAQLAKVQESRARIVAAGDAERRRIERDIHDGAQQRLVALGLELTTLRRRVRGTIDPELERALASAVAELRTAVEELRELARGVHPAVLTDEGLAAALAWLAGRTPLMVDLDARLSERLAPEIEAAAYFVACEALANTVKHARATSVRISAGRTNGTLVIEVADDGVGGATLDGGFGLRGLADRLEAHGGLLQVESGPAGGTCVRGELPCES